MKLIAHSISQIQCKRRPKQVNISTINSEHDGGFTILDFFFQPEVELQSVDQSASGMVYILNKDYRNPFARGVCSIKHFVKI
jgi:hypothetical protein